MIGRTLLHYRITAELGKGGMGSVYRARDTQLDRDVALKLLPPDFASDADRLRRFEREARLLATLNHPNIAAVYGFHEAPENIRFIAMELVEGTTLADRIASSKLSLDDTMDIAPQIASALEAAHDRGIVHRDLKPSNIQVGFDGTVKVLDFGLARSTRDDGLDPGSNARTVTLETRPGVVLGTAPYMSPEQAHGKSTDKRTDIWALGCILFECLSGSRAFEGQTTTDLLTRIVTAQPNFELLPRNTPAFLVQLLHRCLEKDAPLRLRDAGELRVAIEKYRSKPSSDSILPARRPNLRRTVLPWALVALLALALGYAITGPRRATDSPRPVSRWKVPLPKNTRVDLPGPGGKFDYSNVVAISRDGSKVAFSVVDPRNKAVLYVKDDAADPRPISGTENTRAPVFSPDGRWLAFYSMEDGIWKVALRGGSPQRICEVEGRAIAFDASWSVDGETILYSDEGVWRVSVSDGKTEKLTAPEPDRGELGHHIPRFTADGRSILFTISKSGDTHLAVLPVDGSDWDVILEDAAMGVPLGEDRIVFARRGELFAVSFDQSARRVTGRPVPVFQGVHTSPGLGGVVMTWFDLSENGTLVYVPADAPRPDEQLVWVDSDGTESVIAEGPGTWVHPRLSPDGTRISLDIHTRAGMRDVYIYEIARGQFQQLTRTGVTWESEWRPDGEYLSVLSGIRPGTWSLYQVRTDFSGSPELVAEVDHAVPGGWIDDGRAILYTEWNSGGIYRATSGGTDPPMEILATAQRAGFPRLSPNEKWLAFVAEESSSREVFVTPYPELGATRKVSIDGGREPVWARDGSQLFYRHENQMLVVDVTYEPSISFGRPRVLFEGAYDGAEVGHQHYDISLGSDRFLMVKHGEPLGPTEVRVVLNWSEELKDHWK